MMNKNLLHKALKYLLMTLVLIGCVLTLRPNIAAYTKHRGELDTVRAEIGALEAERARLEEMEQALKDEDPELIERLAREKLYLSKPDETIFRFKKKH